MKVDYLECACSLFANYKPMSTPSVKQLEAFWWAATCSNFATAAQRVHLSV
ncbi:helix-turn-helix domain-containing protein, partial [Delftia acidovorans]|uniref:helix-turn-helix domain-containing protein n=1 Tax=Delftia acidovorans TaxID=80866 RepID=UPI0035A0A281